VSALEYDPVRELAEPHLELSPEQRLAVAIIETAKNEYESCVPDLHLPAKEFFFGEDSHLEDWCAVLGWDADWVRGRLKRTKPKKLLAANRPGRAPRGPERHPIQAIRMAAGITQRQLAEYSGVARSAIEKAELGEREPNAFHKEKIMRVLGLHEWPDPVKVQVPILTCDNSCGGNGGWQQQERSGSG
jgi:DNA-binding XRE family transcriptional regulator